MQKVFVNKNTNMVEQILKIKSYDELPDNYFPNCYPIEDDLDNVNGYNLRYNKETEEFEEVEGLPAKDEVEIVEKNEDIKQLKEENEELKARIEKLESLVNQAVLNVR